MGIVNRVSDAAEPHEVKACVAILQLAKQVWKIPIWNGPDAYSLCTNKWCHHLLFTQANLASPATLVAMQQQEQPPTDTTSGSGTTTSHTSSSSETTLAERQHQKAVEMLYQIQQQQQQQPQNHKGPGERAITESTVAPTTTTITTTLDYLVKPNAGGFGVGIEHRQATISATTSSSRNSSSSIQIKPRRDTTRPLPIYSDRIMLFQNYHQPKHGNPRGRK